MAWWLVSLCVWGAERRCPLGRRTRSLNKGVQSRSWAGVNTRLAQVTQSGLAAAQHSEGGRPYRAYILNELPLASTVITGGAQKRPPDACVCPLHSEGVGLALQERTKAPAHWHPSCPPLAKADVCFSPKCMERFPTPCCCVSIKPRAFTEHQLCAAQVLCSEDSVRARPGLCQGTPVKLGLTRSWQVLQGPPAADSRRLL